MNLSGNVLTSSFQFFYTTTYSIIIEISGAKEIWFLISSLASAVEGIIYLAFLLSTPAEMLRRNQVQLVKSLFQSELRSSNRELKMKYSKVRLDFEKMRIQLTSLIQVEILLLQIQQQPMQLSLFGCILLNYTTITFVISQLATWFVLLLQYELESIQD